ncbi:hypothetical protein, partial [Mycobacterium tuberculosis]|uniref:hypothetical protein n=1 Tax=Mycobacterium tuberculosis TaxID=1773 RepID=UPI001262F77F
MFTSATAAPNHISRTEHSGRLTSRESADLDRPNDSATFAPHPQRHDWLLASAKALLGSVLIQPAFDPLQIARQEPRQGPCPQEQALMILLRSPWVGLDAHVPDFIVDPCESRRLHTVKKQFSG